MIVADGIKTNAGEVGEWEVFLYHQDQDGEIYPFHGIHQVAARSPADSASGIRKAGGLQVHWSSLVVPYWESAFNFVAPEDIR